jgi:hypothetical protein
MKAKRKEIKKSKFKENEKLYTESKLIKNNINGEQR